MQTARAPLYWLCCVHPCAEMQGGHQRELGNTDVHTTLAIANLVGFHRGAEQYAAQQGPANKSDQDGRRALKIARGFCWLHHG